MVRKRWGNGLVVASVVGLAKADAAAVGVVAPALRSHLGITEAELGALASASAAAGALAALPAGVLVDRRHRVYLLVVALVGWSLSLGLAGFARGVILLGVARVLSGVIATVARPVAVSLTGDLYRPEVRGRSLARLDTGQAVGTGVCFLLGALAVHYLGWQWLFWWLAAGGVALAVVAAGLGEPARPGPPAPPTTVTLRALVTIRTNVIVLLADSVGNFFYAGATSFAVLFVTERYGLSNATVDALAPLLAIGAVIGILAGGRAGDHLARTHGGARRLSVAAVCQLVATVVFALGLASPSVVVAGMCLFVASIALGAAGPCLDAVRLDIVPSRMRGRAEAARGLLLFGSAALGPVTFGLVATGFGRRTGGLELRDAFAVMLVPLAAGALMLFAAMRPYDGDARAAQSTPVSPAPA